MQQTSDGGFILGGWTEGNISSDKSQASKGGFDYWIIRLDSTGTKLWDKSFGGNGDDILFTVRQTTDGGFILGGDSDSGISGDKSQALKGTKDYWIIKLDSIGVKLWDKSIGGIGLNNFTSLIQTKEGGYFLGGWTVFGIGGDKSEPSKGGGDYWVVKLDTLGNKQWDKTFGGSEMDYTWSVQQTFDGGFILSGWSMSSLSGDRSQLSRGDEDIWIVKIDNNGYKQWDKTFGGTNIDQAYSLQQTSDGGYIVGGLSNSDISPDKSQTVNGTGGGHDYWVLKLNAIGIKIWDKTIGGIGIDELYSIGQTSDGGFIIGGFSNSGIGPDKSQPSQGDFDYWIVKLGPDIMGTPKTQPTFSLSISPNPNQGKFRLQLNNLKTATTEVTITDLLGRTILQKQLPVTDQQISEELEIKTAKGMYLLQVRAGSQTTTRKIVVE